jgi:DNA adenine methylase
MTAIKPAFRYFGSKARTAGELVQLIPPGRPTWVELFAGSAVVTLSKPRSRNEHLNDRNGDIVNLFRILRDPDQRQALCQLITFTPFAKEEFLACLNEMDHADPIERARRFLVVANQGIGGVTKHRTGWRGSSGATTGPQVTWASLPDRLARIAERLQGVAIWNEDATRLLQRFADQPGAVIFADPPYPVAAIKGKARYAVDMTEAEHIAFAEALRACSCAVIMTMAKNTLYDEVLTGWHRLPLTCLYEKGIVAEETIFLNFAPPTGLFGGAL